MSVIRLGTFFGTRLNLDGDQGNLLALKRYLEAAGFAVEVQPVASTDQALLSHFLLMGHGSQAAMNSLADRLPGFDWNRIIQEVPGLAVGSGAEWLTQHLGGLGTFSRLERVSEFRVAELGDLKVLGYRNSDTDLPDLRLEQQFILSMLHGPVLAKNPRLLHKSALAAVRCAGGVWPSVLPAEAIDWISQLNRINSQIWLLETAAEFQPLELKL